MTREEKIAELKAKSATIQEGINDTVRTLTDEEYEAWVEQSVYNINHPLP